MIWLKLSYEAAIKVSARAGVSSGDLTGEGFASKLTGFLEVADP